MCCPLHALNTVHQTLPYSQGAFLKGSNLFYYHFHFAVCALVLLSYFISNLPLILYCSSLRFGLYHRFSSLSRGFWKFFGSTGRRNRTLVMEVEAPCPIRWTIPAYCGAKEIRTLNFLLAKQTRYRCVIAPYGDGFRTRTETPLQVTGGFRNHCLTS